MIDFRYHIVSLVSVFLALAVGIVLGAGPLRDYVADTLSGQVTDLRTQVDGLERDLEGTNASLAGLEEFVTAAGPTLVEGTLASATVTLLVLPDVETTHVEDVRAVLVSAGADVVNLVSINDDFIDASKRPFRSGIAGNLPADMDPQPRSDASAEAVIGQALEQVLSRPDLRDPRVTSQDGKAIAELLASANLVNFETEPRPSLLTVVLTPGGGNTEEELTAGLGLIKGMDAARTLIAGHDAPGTLLETLRFDSAAGDYTTTDSLGTDVGALIIPRALAIVASGGGGSYGFSPNAQSTYPPKTSVHFPQASQPADEVEADQQEPEQEDDEEPENG